MTLEPAREVVSQQLQFGGGYNGDAVRLPLGEIAREHGQAAVDGLIRKLDLEQAFGLAPGTDFSGVGRQGCGAGGRFTPLRRPIESGQGAARGRVMSFPPARGQSKVHTGFVPDTTDNKPAR